MRMLFWSGCALAVTTATVVYLAADYACDHPESSVGRGVIQACRLVTEYNPYLAAARVGATARAPEAQPCAPCACEESSTGDGPHEIIDLTGLGFGCEAVRVNETQTGHLLFGVGVNSDAGLTGNIILNEGNYLVDHAAGCPDEVCPHAIVGVQPFQCAVQGDDCQAAPEQLGMPRCVGTVIINMEEEAREEFQEYLEQILNAANEQAADVPEGPQPVPYYPEESPSEEAESIDPGEPPTCEEVPDYHHQHPECPYMNGSCPRGYYDYPHSYLVPQVEKPKKVKKTKVQKIDSQVFRVPSNLIIECEELESGSATTQGVDTMECRPSDLEESEVAYPPYE
jgi:hypothetical protein